ncbi:hypothetical protein C241_15253 [Bradyrhizobium lupini HPC(L)]|uniref:Uncharacterized protein n=1 Tax=Bradyrhizobium lupini HPC(L) TaxID=1229491 RepID=A0ABN0HKW6_RHILU|nr:hypothetical protein C241_15253 [Bradyrhizobium lupini HPC(L)]
MVDAFLTFVEKIRILCARAFFACKYEGPRFKVLLTISVNHLAALRFPTQRFFWLKRWSRAFPGIASRKGFVVMTYEVTQ